MSQGPRMDDAAPDLATVLALGTRAFLVGLALGLAQPLVGVGIGAGIVAGPSYVGLFFLLCVVVALVTGALALVGGRWLAVPVSVVCGALAAGLLAGNVAAAVFNVGFGA